MHELLEFLRELPILSILTLCLLIWVNIRIVRLQGVVYGKDVYIHVDEPKE